jgi:hypothetical protein
LAAALLLSGCSSGGNVTYREYARILGQAFSSTFSHSSVPREAAASVAYASLGYRIDGGDQGMLVLATDTNGIQLWTSATHVVFQTSDGRITRTVGLPHDLGGTSPQRGQALTPPAAALKAPFASIRLADYPDRGDYGVEIACKAAARQRETVQILGQAIPTIRVDEACENSKLNWRFVDNYWLDPNTSFVWRSIQHLAPGGGAVETEIFRPPD